MEIISIVAIVVGPVVAVIITLWHQGRQEIRKRQFDLFKTIMENRKYYTGTNQDWMKSLNIIEVVFHQQPNILRLWHEYYAMLSMKDRNFDIENNKLLDLLLEIAKYLGYKNLKQTEIDSFYMPIGLHSQTGIGLELQKEQLKYLQNINKSYEGQTIPKTITPL